MRSALLTTVVLSCLLISTGCADNGEDPSGFGQTGGFGAGGSGGVGLTGSGATQPGIGGTAGTGGLWSSGGLLPTGGSFPTGGIHSTGGYATGGATGGSSSGGTSTGGVAPTGGFAPTGGVATGGTSTGGVAPTGGLAPTGGTGTGGSETGGLDGTGGGITEIDCDAPMPSGGQDHCGQNTQGTAGGLSWSLWSNSLNSQSCITTYDTTAFGASWNNSGDFLARLGLEWGNNSRPYTDYGVIKADFSYTKTGSGGGYSYIGVYGWTFNQGDASSCVEYYIVDDRYGTMPFDAWNATQTGSATIDGETYKLFRNQTNGTGGSRCSGVTTWNQYWSIRQTARQCGTISVSEHFDAWQAAGMQMSGNLLEAKILVEVGGGQGSIDFPVANVVAE